MELAERLGGAHIRGIRGRETVLLCILQPSFVEGKDREVLSTMVEIWLLDDWNVE